MIYVMVGIPASGKSTIANDLAIEHNAEIISTDKIREEFYGSEEIQGNGSFVFATAYNRVAKAINENRDVVFDATNVSIQNRHEIIKRFPNTKKIAVAVITPYEECLRRNKSRDRHVPERVMKSMWERFSLPTVEEGFDAVEIYC